MRVGQILDALMRDVRFLSSIGLHVEGMSVDESRRMFAELAWLDPGNAEQQALRGTYDPGYFAYTFGKLIIVKMREDWTATRGGPRLVACVPRDAALTRQRAATVAPRRDAGTGYPGTLLWLLRCRRASQGTPAGRCYTDLRKSIVPGGARGLQSR